ncbi:MAG: caspase family protein, partial [Syntrophus sp. (in: bacteria)]
IYKIDQFYDVFYRPDIIIAGLRGEDTRGLVTLTMEDALKNPPPEVEISSVPKSTDEENLRIRYNVSSGGGGIGEVRVFHNGKLIYSDGYYKSMVKKSGDNVSLASLNGPAVYQSMRAITIKEKGVASPPPVTTSVASQTKGDSFKSEIAVEAIPGVNEISIAAFNKDNTIQSKMETVAFKSTMMPKDPHLYILAVGIDKYKDASINLAFSAKDARDVASKLLAQSVGIYKRENIHPLVLTDNVATKKNILGKIAELAGKMKPTDGLIIFVAGHGVLYQNLYYLIAHDYNGNINEEAMISSNEIMEMSKKIKSLNQLFIFDTCHAGGVDWIVSGLYDARMSILARQMGLHIFASASSMQEARDGYKGNGLFTHTLLDGLSNNKKCNKNNDGKITIEELGEYTKLETAEISRKTGHEQVPMIINFGNDYPVYELR